MPREYSSFLVRCWHRQGAEHRITVEHIQTGASTRVVSLRAVSDWIAARWIKPGVEDSTCDQRDAADERKEEPS